MSTSTNVGSSARAVGIVFQIFGVLSLLANAVLTGLYGFHFLNGALGVVLMLLFFDAAALAWYCARQSSNLSGDQRAAAKIMSVTTIVGSTLVSVVQVLDMANVIGTAGWGHTFATWLVTAYAAANFLALFYYQYTSVRERQVDLQEELQAQTNDKVNEMTREAHAKAMHQATAVLMGKTEAIGNRIAYNVEREFLRAFDSLDLLQEVAPTLQRDRGAAAGAKEVVGAKAATPAPDPTPTLARTAGECDCGLPLGTAADECPGGDACVIDANATTDVTASQLQDAAQEYLDHNNHLNGFQKSFFDTEVIKPGNGLTRAEIRESIKQMQDNLTVKPLDLRP